MEKLFNGVSRNTKSERVAEMLPRMEAIRQVAGSMKKLTNNQLHDKLKEFG